MMRRIHTQSQRHFAITGLAGKGVACPACKAAETHPCFIQEQVPNKRGDHTRYNMHTVHIERVRAMGHSVKC